MSRLSVNLDDDELLLPEDPQPTSVSDVDCTATASGSSAAPVLERSHYYVLLMFFMLTQNQCLFWFTFSSAPDPIEAYYQMGDSTVDALLRWGPIVFLGVVPFAAWLISRPQGIKRTMQMAALLSLLGCVIRMVPGFFPDVSYRHSESGWAWLHAGQILNAAVGPLVMAAPSRVSAVWFPPNRRTTATAIIYFGGSVGSGVGFLLGPWVVTEPAHVPRLLLIETILAGVFFLLALVYSPDHPKVSPSPAIQIEPATAQHSTVETSHLLQSKAMFKNLSLMLLVLAGGIEAGASSAWGGVLPQILSRPTYSADFAGICGFINNMAGVGGALAIGVIADRWFRRRLKRLLIASFALTTLAYMWFTLSLASPFSASPLLPTTHATIIIASILTGLFQGACDPLFYELAAEITYPLPEGYSAGLITFVYNAAALIMLYVAPVISNSWMNTMTTIAFLVSALLTACAVEKYKRSDHDSPRLGNLGDP